VLMARAQFEKLGERVSVRNRSQERVWFGLPLKKRKRKKRQEGKSSPLKDFGGAVTLTPNTYAPSD